jgi:hypothetical protein
MSVSPSPERIEICTPPDSPDVVFDDSEQGWSPIDMTFAPTSNGPITPVRNPRGIVPRRRFKRKRVDSADAMSIATPTNDHRTGSPDTSKEYSEGSAQRDEENVSGVLDLAASTSSIFPGVVYEPSGCHTPNTTGWNSATEEMEPFEHYVNAALADCAGFFQISKQLFVVQGWDEKWQRSTVGRQNTGTQATSLSIKLTTVTAILFPVIVVSPAACLDWKRVLYGVHLHAWTAEHVSAQVLSTAIPE